MGVVSARHIAFEGGVFVLSVGNMIRKASYPSDFEFAEELAAVGDFLLEGGTCIAAPDGRLLAGPLFKEEGTLYADLDLNETIKAAQLLDVPGHYARSEVLGLRFNQERIQPIEQGTSLTNTASSRSIRYRVRTGHAGESTRRVE
jgi:nitrilase